MLVSFSSWLPFGDTFSNNSTQSRQLLTTAVLLTGIPACWLVCRALLRHNEKRKKLPPGPDSHFLLGSVPYIQKLRNEMGTSNRDALMLELSKRFGLIFTVWVPVTGRLVIAADPKFVKHVLVTKNYPKAPSYQRLAPLFGSRSMLTLPSKEWASKRRAFNPGFGPSFLKDVVAVMTEKLERFVEAINEDIALEQNTNMVTRAKNFTSDVIVAVAFGEDWGGKEPHPARILEEELNQLLTNYISRPIGMVFDFKTKWMIRKCEQKLDDEMIEIVERRLSKKEDASSVTKDICTTAIDQIKQESKSSNLSSEDKISVAHQLKTFYFAGHETTAVLISWVIWSLSQHPLILSKLRAELNELGIWGEGDTTKKHPTYDDLLHCTYLEAILKECLRLYPPAGSGRFAADEGEMYNGYAIGGCTIGVNVFCMHRHPSLWKEPECFRPERFLDGSEENLSEKFIPFMRGPRDCIGKHFAMLEAKLAVSRLVLKYDFDCVDPKEEIARHLTAGPKNGAQVKFRLIG